jgi:hypothetical protein
MSDSRVTRGPREAARSEAKTPALRITSRKQGIHSRNGRPADVRRCVPRAHECPALRLLGWLLRISACENI